MHQPCGPDCVGDDDHVPERVRPELLAEIREHLDRNLKRRGTTVEAILDCECHGTLSQKASIKFGRFWRNVLVMFGHA